MSAALEHSADAWIQEATSGIAEPVREMIAAEIRAHLEDAQQDSLTEKQAITHLGSADQTSHTYQKLYPRASEEHLLLMTATPSQHQTHWTTPLYRPAVTLLSIGYGIILFTEGYRLPGLLTALPFVLFSPVSSSILRRTPSDLKPILRARHGWIHMGLTFPLICAVVISAGLTSDAPRTADLYTTGFLAILSVLITGALIIAAGNFADSRAFVQRFRRAGQRARPADPSQLGRRLLCARPSGPHTGLNGRPSGTAAPQRKAPHVASACGAHDQKWCQPAQAMLPLGMAGTLPASWAVY